MAALNQCIKINSPNIPVLEECELKAKGAGQFITNNILEHADICVDPFRSRDLYLPNFSLQEYQGKYDRNVVLSNQHGACTDLMGACLILKGEVRTFRKKVQEGSPSFNYSQNFKYDPDNELLHLLPANKSFHIVHFSFSTSYFSELIPQHEKWADVLLSRVNNRESFIGPKFTPITSVQERAYQNIIDCPLDGKLGYMMMESSMTQIILLQMHATFRENPVANPKLSQRDVDLIHCVKDYIDEHFLDDHSLTSLSRQFCTNTNKLMSVFRLTFGKSVFDFIAEKRMNYAKEILLSKDILVAEVARAVGYRNANHFSVAFKKKFGISPSQLKS